MKCKSALNKSRMYGIDYTINPYFGCNHACLYCYVPYLIGTSYDEFRVAEVKENILEVLRKELRKKKRGLVGISTSTDAYQPLEKKYGISREILKLLKMYKFPVDIQTKSPLVLRDVDIIKEMEASVGITITTMDCSIARIWEPNAPSPSKRMDAAKKIARMGIFTYIFIGPVFPLIKKSEIDYLMEESIDGGISEIVVDKLHVKKGMEEVMKRAFPHEYRKILRNENFPEILKKIMKYGEKIKIRMAWK